MLDCVFSLALGLPSSGLVFLLGPASSLIHRLATGDALAVTAKTHV